MNNRYQMLVYRGPDNNDPATIHQPQFLPYSSCTLANGSRIGWVTPSPELSASERLQLEYPGYRFRVELSEDLKHITRVLRPLGRNELLVGITKEINLHNAAISNAPIQTGPRVRHASIPVPEGLKISQMKWDIIVTGMKIGKYIMMMGPKGSGKTAVAYAAAKALGYDFCPMNCATIVKPKSILVGTVGARDGSTYLTESEFMKYFRSDRPTVIFLDEITRISPQAANYLMTILDKSQSYIYSEDLGERIYKGEGVVFIAAGNVGIRYNDTRKLDDAFEDRFTKVHMSYASSTEEAAILMERAPGIAKKEAEKLVRIAHSLRPHHENLGAEISTRQLIDLAHYLEAGFTVDEVVDEIMMNSFINGAEDTREQVKLILDGTA